MKIFVTISEIENGIGDIDVDLQVVHDDIFHCIASAVEGFRPDWQECPDIQPEEITVDPSVDGSVPCSPYLNQRGLPLSYFFIPLYRDLSPVGKPLYRLQEGTQIRGIDAMSRWTGNEAVVRGEGQDQRPDQGERAEPGFFGKWIIYENGPVVGIDEFHPDISRALEEIPDGCGRAIALGTDGYPVGCDPAEALQGGGNGVLCGSDKGEKEKSV